MNLFPLATLAGLALCLMISTVMAGEVYRCDSDDGPVRFQDKPCQTGTSVMPRQGLYGFSVVGSSDGAAAGVYGLASNYRERTRRHVAARTQSGQALKQKLARDRRVEEAIRDRAVLEGMSQDEVRRAWGSPDAVASSTRGDRWIYYDGYAGKRFASFTPSGSVEEAGSRPLPFGGLRKRGFGHGKFRSGDYGGRKSSGSRGQIKHAH